MGAIQRWLGSNLSYHSCMIRKRGCGISTFKFSGCKVGIRIQKFSMAQPLKGRGKKFIKGLKDDNGVWREDEDTFLGLLNEY